LGPKLTAERTVRDIFATGEIDPERFGEKGAGLARLAALGAPVKPGVLIAADAVAQFDTEGVEAALGPVFVKAFSNRAPDSLLSVRSSAGERNWGGAPAILNIGACEAAMPILSERVGARAAWDLYRRLIQSYAVGAMGVDSELFEIALHDATKFAGVHTEGSLDEAALRRLVARYLEIVEEDVEEAFPQDPWIQLLGALSSMARAWNAPTACILRESRGGPAAGGLAIIVQEMALGLGPDPSGAGVVGFRNERTGEPGLTGRFLPQAQGEDALMGLRTPRFIATAEREAAGLTEPALEEIAPGAAATLAALGPQVERQSRDAQTLEFTLENGMLFILDAAPAKRTARSSIRMAVDLAKSGAITREEAVLRIEPRTLTELLHPSIDPAEPRDVIARGLPASPGAASGGIVFSAEAAEAAAARGEKAILVRIETSPEDIRGMHSAAGVLTMRGGMTSHAAVVARGLGAPCVVGASSMHLDPVARRLTADDGRIFLEGDVITIDGAAGEALAGAAPTVQPEFSGPLAELMVWADDFRRMRVRANADTPQDAEMALTFSADGIGLCRTEHMFFEQGRITAMREVIMADDEAVRREALSRLLPMQRSDFVKLFRVMASLPVTIRLLDPPLHEFLPHGAEELREMAAAMHLSIDQVKRRADDLQEFNPMLGKRGCRLGVTMPEIYEMQARAIFEALAEGGEGAQSVDPEIMIPLVSARREVELIRDRIDAVAQEVGAEKRRKFVYSVGVMVETPRAALRAGDIAMDCEFLSFGTNDLTQMAYGLSRDDAGRFMRDYVNKGVFQEDPFHTLDLEGVGELLLIATERARAKKPNLSLGLCGEHGGDPASIRFCEVAGFDYVSCSPFRVPIARLAAAQATILARTSGRSDGS
jgi:pyruvate,orthophosphate dikinase